MRQPSNGFLFVLFVAVHLVFSLLFTAEADAASALKIDAKANAALKQFFDEVPAGKELTDKATGILIFPFVVKGGIGIGGEYGEGVLRIDGYTADYYSTASGSIGLQVGVQSKSVIILFMTSTALDNFRYSDGWEVGVDGSVAVIRVGAGGFLDTITADTSVIGFIFNQKGFMGNLTLEGTKISRLIR